jgi:glycosyltransferase involved in cell wall biosynthesis
MDTKPTKVVHMTSVHWAMDNRIFYKECRSLAKAGFQVTVVGPHTEDTVEEGVRIKSIPLEHSRLLRMTRTVWRVYREAKKQQADIYHFHDPELILAALLLRASGKDVIYDIHEDVPKDIMSKAYLPVWSRKMIAWMAETVEGLVSKYFSALVTVTPSIAKRFQALNQKTIMVCNYPFQKEIAPAHEASPWDERRPSVAYVGLISKQRGIREMVEALDLLPKSMEMTLELAGNEIPEEIDLQELKQLPGWSRVKHHGLLDRSTTLRLLRGVRAGLVLFHPVPNSLESMPQKIFEYMGAGLPVIASDFPLWRQIMGGAGCGIFVDPLNPREIARAIEYIVSNPAEAEEMGRRAQAAMIQQYDWNGQAEKLVELYTGLSRSTCAA